MTAIAGIIATLVILALCALGLGVGVLCGRKGLRSCGRAAGEHPDVSCPGCGGDAAKCERKETKGT